VHIRAKTPTRRKQALATLVEASLTARTCDGIVLRGNLLLRNGELDQASDVLRRCGRLRAGAR